MRTTTLGPFGEVIRQTGPMAKANPIRFSTKYQDDESDLLYYGYRYYKPSTGTWLSRDPVEEAGFDLSNDRPGMVEKTLNMGDIEALVNLIREVKPEKAESVRNELLQAYSELNLKAGQGIENLYTFVCDDPLNKFDLLGLQVLDGPIDGKKHPLNLGDCPSGWQLVSWKMWGHKINPRWKQIVVDAIYQCKCPPKTVSQQSGWIVPIEVNPG